MHICTYGYQATIYPPLHDVGGCVYTVGFNVWLGGRVVRTLDLRSTGREFESSRAFSNAKFSE